MNHSPAGRRPSQYICHGLLALFRLQQLSNRGCRRYHAAQTMVVAVAKLKPYYSNVYGPPSTSAWYSLRAHDSWQSRAQAKYVEASDVGRTGVDAHERNQPYVSYPLWDIRASDSMEAGTRRPVS